MSERGEQKSMSVSENVVFIVFLVGSITTSILPTILVSSIEITYLSFFGKMRHARFIITFDE